MVHCPLRRGVNDTHIIVLCKRTHIHEGKRKLIIFNKSHSIQNQTEHVGVLSHRTKYKVRRAIVCARISIRCMDLALIKNIEHFFIFDIRSIVIKILNGQGRIVKIKIFDNGLFDFMDEALHSMSINA